MRTDWVQVVAALVVGVGGGTLMLANAESLAALQRRQAATMRYPEGFRRRLTAGWVRFVGVGFIVIGIVGAVLGLFFADLM